MCADCLRSAVIRVPHSVLQTKRYRQTRQWSALDGRSHGLQEHVLDALHEQYRDEGGKGGGGSRPHGHRPRPCTSGKAALPLDGTPQTSMTKTGSRVLEDLPTPTWPSRGVGGAPKPRMTLVLDASGSGGLSSSAPIVSSAGSAPAASLWTAPSCAFLRARCGRANQRCGGRVGKRRGVRASDGARHGGESGEESRLMERTDTRWRREETYRERTRAAHYSSRPPPGRLTSLGPCAGAS